MAAQHIPRIAMIAAIGRNRELGKYNKLLWHIPQDMQRFREITRGHVVILGRKTYESIGKALPGRPNIVVSHDRTYHRDGITVAHSFAEALEKAKQIEKSEIFIIGGARIYEQAIPFADILYLTLVDSTYDADAYFPDYQAFTRVTEVGEGEYHGLSYRFIQLER